MAKQSLDRRGSFNYVPVGDLESFAVPSVLAGARAAHFRVVVRYRLASCYLLLVDNRILGIDIYVLAAKMPGCCPRQIVVCRASFPL